MSQRLDYLDVGKGIGIILVILGHCQLGRVGNLHSVLYSFHMPLFFIISGICYSNKYSFSSLATRRFRQMILPTIYFSLISLLVVDGLELQVTWWDWSKHLPFALWFLPVLYFAELIAWLICNKVKDRLYQAVVLLTLMLVPHLLTYYSIDLPYSVAAIPTATFFFVFGYTIKPFILNWDKHLLMLAVLFAILNIGIVRYGHVSVELASGFISPVIVAEFAAFCGLFSCLAFSKAQAGGGNSRFTQLLIWFGRNSLCLMLVHQLIKTILDKYTEYMFSNDLLYLCFQFLGTIFLSATLTILINNYIPILVGKRKV